MSEWSIPLSDLDYGIEEEEAVLRVLRSKWLSMGVEVQTFEHEFAQFLGVKHAIAVANGTAALHLTPGTRTWFRRRNYSTCNQLRSSSQHDCSHRSSASFHRHYKFGRTHY